MTQLQEEMTGAPVAANADLKFEAVVIPVSDVDRAKEFYTKLGWRFDVDFRFDNGFRVVQLTPPGSDCSVQFGTKITSAEPGSAQGIYKIVSDIEGARAELAARGAAITEVFHDQAPGAQFRLIGPRGRLSGPAPDHESYRSYATFNDPDGNTWVLQEVTTRMAGHMNSAATTFASANDLATFRRKIQFWAESRPGGDAERSRVQAGKQCDLV